jgi:FtsP/CotA-like multicopper oxidase with cupredoxin domain
MRRRNIVSGFQIAALMLVSVLASTTAARAEIPGVSGPNFTLTAKADHISTPDGNSVLIWGFANGNGRAQYPGPTLLTQEGATVTITVTNDLPSNYGQRVSLSFPGQTGVTATCAVGPCVQGPLGLEAAARGSSLTYTFTASRSGTFLYNSASRPELQVEMGLTGALIVRPSGFDPVSSRRAYGYPESRYDQEYLFFLSEMDSLIHDMVELQGVGAADQSGRLANYFSNYWFINGRNAPDTMAAATAPGTGMLPTQPYNALPRTHPGDRVLMRVVGGGRDMHPFHHHGNHARIIAVDGFELKTSAASSYDLSREVFTIASLPGQTVDAIFRWTGKDIGWDIYGTGPDFAHTCGGGNVVGHPLPGEGGVDSEGLDPITREYCGDHGKPLPVALPATLNLDFGGFWSGSPFLGTLALLPPGLGGLNPDAGYTYMWHSHTEKEITNYDVFPGGMMTMLIVEPLGTPIP